MVWFIFDALSNAPPTRAGGAGVAELGLDLNLFHEELNFQRASSWHESVQAAILGVRVLVC